MANSHCIVPLLVAVLIFIEITLIIFADWYAYARIRYAPPTVTTKHMHVWLGLSVFGTIVSAILVLANCYCCYCHPERTEDENYCILQNQWNVVIGSLKDFPHLILVLVVLNTEVLYKYMQNL